ncbi:MAG: ABC transporter ATP-binding protein, partial [Chloroflexi bacterium]|nr:ABC transporter ATP-binding protein [Chloroflexota bacterium]
MRLYWRVLKYMREYWVSQVIAYLCMLAINGVLILSPQIIRRIIDEGIGKQRLDVLAWMSLALVGVTILRGAFRFGERYLSERVSQGIAYRMRNQLYWKLHSLSFSYHDRAQTGQLLSRATSDVERLRELTGRGLLRLVDSIVLLISTTVVLLRMQPRLAALSLAVMPFVAIIMRRYMARQQPAFRERQNLMAVMTTRLEQNLLGVSVVRGFAQEPQEIARFAAVNDDIYDISMATARRSSFTMPFIVLLASLGTVLILWVGGRMVVAGELTLGALVAFNSYVLQLVNPMRRLGFIVTRLVEAHASAERVFEILDAESEVKNKPDAIELGPIRGEVTFEHVSFQYVGGNKVLDDVSFHVEPGQVVALLGPTGAGKSTITNLIPRFYDVTEGRVLIDGVDVRDVTIESLRRQIGIVLQETQLFGSTVRENITFGRPDATEEEMIAAAKAAAAHDFIMRF